MLDLECFKPGYKSNGVHKPCLVSVKSHSEKGFIFILPSFFLLAKHTLSAQLIKNAHPYQEQSYSGSSSGVVEHARSCILPFKLCKSQRESFSGSDE